MQKIMLILITVSMLALSACGVITHGSNISDEPDMRPPLLRVSLPSREGEDYIIAAGLSSSWNIDFDDGTSLSQETDAPHPMDLGDYGRFTLYMEAGTTEIHLQFDIPPQSFRVERWYAELADPTREYEWHETSMNVEAAGHVIPIVNDGGDYIYAVWASWERSRPTIGYGNSLYVFRVNSTYESWVQDRINTAIAVGLVPQNLQTDYTQAVTRAEFCALAVLVYERARGEITGRTAFIDTNDVNVQKAAYAGIVNGIGDNRFDPDVALTREQAAVMLANLTNVLDADLPVGLWIMGMHPSAAIADYDTVSSWAAESVVDMFARGIMSDVGNRMFAPQQPYTRERSIITIMRVFDIVFKEGFLHIE